MCETDCLSPPLLWVKTFIKIVVPQGAFDVTAVKLADARPLHHVVRNIMSRSQCFHFQVTKSLNPFTPDRKIDSPKLIKPPKLTAMQK